MPASLVARLFFWLWFGGAVLIGNSHVLQRASPLALQGIILGLTGLVALAYFSVRPARVWFDAIPLRVLVLLHLTRFVGFYFLTLYQRGDLPRALAIPAAICDIVVATMALPVAFAPLSDAARLRVITIWNVVGFAAMVIVLTTVLRLHLAGPLLLRPLNSLPLSLWPTFLVPAILATHIIIFARVAKEKAALAGNTSERV